MTPEVIVQFAEILQKYGGWSLSVILGYAIYKLYQSTNKALQQQMEKLIELVKECATVIGNSNLERERVEEILDRVEKALEKEDALRQTMERRLNK